MSASGDRVAVGLLEAANDPTLVDQALAIVRLVDELLPRVQQSIQAIYTSLPDEDFDLAAGLVDGTGAREADTLLMVVGARLVDQLGGHYSGPVTWADAVARAEGAAR